MATEKQIRANTENRKRWTGLTVEGMATLRETAKRNQPWRHSTGPRTAAGKARSSRNALTHGGRSAETAEAYRNLQAILRKMRTELLSG